MKVGEWLKLYREQHNLSMQALADLCGFSKAYINVLEKGVNPKTGKPISPTMQTFEKIACGTKTDVDTLLKILDSDQPITVNAPASDDLPANVFPVQTKKVPLLGTIAAGVPIYADENFDGYRECTEDVDADFCLKIQGDSMIGANIQDGCLILVNPNAEVRSGDIAYVRWNDRCSVKGILFYNDGRIELRPANKDFSSIWIERDEVEFLTILGKVVRWLNMGVPNRIF